MCRRAYLRSDLKVAHYSRKHRLSARFVLIPLPSWIPRIPVRWPGSRRRAHTPCLSPRAGAASTVTGLSPGKEICGPGALFWSLHLTARPVSRGDGPKPILCRNPRGRGRRFDPSGGNQFFPGFSYFLRFTRLVLISASIPCRQRPGSPVRDPVQRPVVTSSAMPSIYRSMPRESKIGIFFKKRIRPSGRWICSSRTVS